jgi:pimeloyl-ACP methyl ester carboxylesterase
MPRYVISARKIVGDSFSNDPKAEPGAVSFLRVPDDATDLLPAYAVRKRDVPAWSQEVQGLADGDENPNSISPKGDVLVLVHGYNTSTAGVLQGHKSIEVNLRAGGWRGLVISFDWPSSNSVLNYLEDRSKGAAVALLLVKQCIGIIADGQADKCETNVHVLGHSTGAYVIMEAFVQAQKAGGLYKSPWRIGQVAFISGDVASSSLDAASEWSGPMFSRIMRLTNYSNPNDAVLAVSNAKRLGTEPRAGRVGLPDDHDPKAVNVNCGKYFRTIDPPPGEAGIGWTHSWWFGDEIFARDLAMTLEGAIDRNFIPTREGDPGNLVLIAAKRPENMADWQIKASIQPPKPPDA